VGNFGWLVGKKKQEWWIWDAWIESIFYSPFFFFFLLQRTFTPVCCAGNTALNICHILLIDCTSSVYTWLVRQAFYFLYYLL
jgi:hypothetical protein